MIHGLQWTIKGLLKMVFSKDFLMNGKCSPYNVSEKDKLFIQCDLDFRKYFSVWKKV